MLDEKKYIAVKLLAAAPLKAPSVPCDHPASPDSASDQHNEVGVDVNIADARQSVVEMSVELDNDCGLENVKVEAELDVDGAKCPSSLPAAPVEAMLGESLSEN